MTALALAASDGGKALTPYQEVQKEISTMGTRLKSVLPSHIDPAKFQRVAMTAIQADPDLLNADRQSLYTAMTKAATDGLLPDKREGALTVANTKVKIDGRDVYVKMVVWMPMVAGILKKVRQSGEVVRMIAKPVYEKDEFDVLFGDDDRIFHKPFLDGHPGKLVGAYSIVHLKDGSISRDFLPIWRIERAKAAAKTKYVWDAWPDEMAVKTVIRHHAKLLPQSTDIEAAFERDDTQQFDMAATMLGSAPAAPAPLTGAALLAQAAPSDAGETVVAETITDLAAPRSPAATNPPPADDGEATQGAGVGAAPNWDNLQADARAFVEGVLSEVELSPSTDMLEMALMRSGTVRGLKTLEKEYPAEWRQLQAIVEGRRAALVAPSSAAGSYGDDDDLADDDGVVQ